MKNFSKNILLIVSFCLFSQALEAQQVVTGQITDATDGTTIPGVYIFIANSTNATTSDRFGNYSITVQGTGSFEIVEIGRAHV